MEEGSNHYWQEKLKDRTELKLRKHGLSDHDCIYLGKALEENDSVKLLQLRSSGLGLIGLTSIADALRHNTSLTEFELNGNNGVGDEGAEVFAVALKENGRISSLHLCAFGIGRDGATSLAATLRFSQSLMCLDLEKNNIRADGTLALCDILKSNSVLIELSLINNNIGDIGAEHMADCLRVNKALKILYLQQNQIGDEGVTCIAEALKMNTTLTTLGLGYNHGISPDGFHSIAQGLKDNSSLIWLSGIDLSSFAQSIFCLSKKQLDKVDWESDANNVSLLEQASITRELTKIRYANLTAKYKKDSRIGKGRGGGRDTMVRSGLQRNVSGMKKGSKSCGDVTSLVKDSRLAMTRRPGNHTPNDIKMDPASSSSSKNKLER